VKILLVVDIPNWALDRTADMIIKHLPYDIEKIYTDQFKQSMTKKYNYVHFMNWLDGKEYDSVSGGVCSHNWELKHLGQAKKKMPKMRALTAISRRLCLKLKRYNSVHYCPNGVDLDMFTPGLNDHEFTVGWVGQKTKGGFGETKSNEGVKGYDIKGYELILNPLMKRLENKVKFKVLDRAYSDAWPYSLMPGWYSNIDMLICTSLYEGCPFPVLEAAASGKAIVSTDVGVVNEISDFLIKSPSSRKEVSATIDEFEKKILYLAENRDICSMDGEKSRERVKKFSWTEVVHNWKEVFK
jgi:glycosyltransferase involved in cell wall biosynthesis